MPERAGYIPPEATLEGSKDKLKLWGKESAPRFALGMCLGAVVNCASVNHEFKNTHPEQFEQRKELKTEWLNNFKLVVDKSNDEEASGVYNYVLTHNYMVMPLKEEAGLFTPLSLDGVEIEQPKDKDDSVGLAIISHEDQKKRNFHTQATNFTIGAYTQKNISGGYSIVIHDFNSQPAWKGLLFLHEGKHVMQLRESPGMLPKNSKEMSEDEVETYELEYNVLAKMGGQKFNDLMRAKIQEVKNRNFSITPAAGDKFLYDNFEYVDELDAILGPSLSYAELRGRTCLINFHITMALIAEEYKNEGSDKIKEEQAKWYRTMSEWGTEEQ